MEPEQTNPIQIYTTADGRVALELRLEQDTLWLTQLQMGELFGTTPENVLMHLKNIYKDNELAEDQAPDDDMFGLTFISASTRGHSRDNQYCRIR